MRYVVYKGKRISDDKWIRGSLIVSNGRTWIKNTEDKCSLRAVSGDGWADFRCVEVVPDTVSESTDMIDDYDNEVFEGDMLEFEGYMGDDYYIQIAKSDDAPHNFIMGYRQKPESGARGISEGMFVILESLPKSCRVIGNIHNKELEMFNHERDNI